MKKTVGYILLLLALVMFYLGYRMAGLPPVITGVGFVLIGVVFLTDQ